MKIERKSRYIIAVEREGKHLRIWQPPEREWSDAEVSEAVKASDSLHKDIV